MAKTSSITTGSIRNSAARRNFQALVAELHAHGMGLILDIVPNHMAVGGRDNAWWLDTLEWGEELPFAA